MALDKAVDFTAMYTGAYNGAPQQEKERVPEGWHALVVQSGAEVATKKSGINWVLEFVDASLARSVTEFYAMDSARASEGRIHRSISKLSAVSHAAFPEGKPISEPSEFQKAMIVAAVADNEYEGQVRSQIERCMSLQEFALFPGVDENIKERVANEMETLIEAHAAGSITYGRATGVPEGFVAPSLKKVSKEERQANRAERQAARAEARKARAGGAA